MISAEASHGSPVVLITGASGGVGRGIALACASAGWTVWVASRDCGKGTAVAEEINAHGGRGRYVGCDVTDLDAVRHAIAAVIDRDGRLDGAVHNATSGFSPRPSALSELTLAELRDHVAVSVRGTFVLAVVAGVHLRATGGSLLVLTSEAGFEGKAKLPAYAAVKAAQRGFMRALAREWGPHGVRANCLAPLAATQAVERAFALDDQMAERVGARCPLGRLGDPTLDIGPVARFLLSPEARYVTGVTMMADGGSCPIS